MAACFDCGARNVAPHFGDDFTTRESFLRADAAVFEEYPSRLGMLAIFKPALVTLPETSCPARAYMEIIPYQIAKHNSI